MNSRKINFNNFIINQCELNLLLWKDKLTYEDIQLVCEFLKHHPNIKSLKVDAENQQVGVESIKLLFNNNTIQNLYLMDAKLPLNMAIEFYRNNFTITDLNMDWNWASTRNNGTYPMFQRTIIRNRLLKEEKDHYFNNSHSLIKSHLSDKSDIPSSTPSNHQQLNQSFVRTPDEAKEVKHDQKQNEYNEPQELEEQPIGPQISPRMGQTY